MSVSAVGTITFREMTFDQDVSRGSSTWLIIYGKYEGQGLKERNVDTVIDTTSGESLLVLLLSVLYCL